MKCYGEEYGIAASCIPEGYIVGERLPNERRDGSCLGELFIQLDGPRYTNLAPTFPVGTVLCCDLNDGSICPWFTEHGCARNSEYWCNLAPLIKINDTAHQMAESKREERAAKVLDIAGQIMACDYAAGNECMQGAAEEVAKHCIERAATLYDEHQKWMGVDK